MQDGQFFTWEALSAMGGASLLTFFIVQYTKAIVDRYVTIPTDVYAVVVAFCVLVLAQMALGSSWADWRVYGLTGANAFLVAAAAGQMQRKALNPPGEERGL